MENRASYIPALDGLRAVSILLVLIFHLNKSYLSGGFIGVDIFFVISGYIISRQILQSRNSQTFVFTTFYWKRFTRLVPAATTVAVLTYLISLYAFSSERVSELTGSFSSSVLWFSNVYYYFNVGYFDTISSSNPFLHYWSLSVEEQFYLIWPAIIIFIIGAKLYRFLILLLLSLLFSFSLFLIDPQAMFYLAPARIFQFAAGALIACAHLNHSNRFNSKNGIAAATGIISACIIAISAFYASGENYNFAIGALAPTVGAVGIILFVNSTPMRLTLGSGWLTWIGHRAYSIYLVHWPIMVFASFYLGPNKPLLIDVLLLLACFAAADLLYHNIETPLRRYGRDAGSRPGTAVGLSLIFLVSISVCALIFASTFLQRGSSNDPAAHFTPQEPSETATHTNVNPDEFSFGANHFNELAREIRTQRYQRGRISRGCHLPYGEPFEIFQSGACLPSEPAGNKVMLIGDSYGAETIPLIETWVAPDQLISAVSGGCLPIFPEPGSSSRPQSCQELNRYRYNVLENRDDVTAVVLVSNWRHWRENNIESTIRHILSLGKHVFVIGARPQFSESIPALLDSPIGAQVHQDLSRYHLYDPYEKNALLQEIVGRFEGAYFIDILPTFCPDSCPALFGSQQLIYMDAAHTGPDFAEVIAEQVQNSQPHVTSNLRAALNGSRLPQQLSNPEEPQPLLNLRLECAAINENLPAATRRFQAQMINGTFRFQLGTQEDDRYERWEGTVDADGHLTIEGEYIEGAGGIKSVQLEGIFRRGELSASGNRGVRQCDLFID